MGVLSMRRRALLAFPLLLASGRRVLAQKPSQRPPLLVIVAQGSSVEAFTLAALRGLFLGDVTTAPDGTKLIPINHPPGSAERVAFDRVLLGMSPEQAGRYWIDRRIRGEGRPPRTCDPLIVPRLIAKFPGTISYLRAASVDAALKIVRIAGRRPGERGYPLAD